MTIIHEFSFYVSVKTESEERPSNEKVLEKVKEKLNEPDCENFIENIERFLNLYKSG